MKRALSLLRHNKSVDLHTIKNEFLKYGGGSNCNFTIGLFPTNTTIRGYTNSVKLINFHEHR